MFHDELRQLDDALRYVRARAEIFFGGAGFEASQMAVLLVREALQWGVPSVAVVRAGNWVIVHSPADWLGEDGLESFRRIIAFPEGGQNAMRMEVLTTAFAEAVITKAHGTIEQISGAAETSILSGYAEQGRAVAFLVTT